MVLKPGTEDRENILASKIFPELDHPPAEGSILIVTIDEEESDGVAVIVTGKPEYDLLQDVTEIFCVLEKERYARAFIHEKDGWLMYD